jgi:hypothetical protein
VCYQSTDQVNYTSTVYTIAVGAAATAVQLVSPFFRITVRNKTGSVMSFLNITTIYRAISVDTCGTDLLGTVDISNWLDFSFDGQSKLKCVDTSLNAKIDTLNITVLDVSVGLSKLINTRQQAVFFNGTYYDGSYGDTCLNLSAKTSQNCISVYGNTNLDSSFTVCYSANGTTPYDTQYYYTAPAGNFGFNLPATGASYLHLKVHITDVSAAIYCVAETSA